MISVEDYLWFVDDALDAMTGIVLDLGDDLANRAPQFPGANTPYAVLTHCLGVIEYWTGHVVAGRSIERDREAEFISGGPVGDLARRVEDAKTRMRHDLRGFEAQSAPRGSTRPRDSALPLARTQGGVMMHVYEELAQHRGQMELTRDVLRAPWAQFR